MKTTKLTVIGNSIFATFVKQNLSKILERKINILNPENGFLYFTPNGEFKEGRNNEYGQSALACFGGIATNEKKAVKQLQELIDMESFDADLDNGKLKKFIK